MVTFLIYELQEFMRKRNGVFFQIYFNAIWLVHFSNVNKLIGCWLVDWQDFSVFSVKKFESAEIEKWRLQQSRNFAVFKISIISVQLVAESERSFDSFIIQVRGEDDDSKNSTFYGQWKGIPQIGELIDCGKYRGAAIVDKAFHPRCPNKF